MFDVFKFLEDRNAGLPITESDSEEISVFLVNQALSQDSRYIMFAERLNTEAFTKLPKDLQAAAYRSLHGRKTEVKWTRTKSSIIRERDAIVLKCMKVLNMTRSSVLAAMKYNMVDIDKVLLDYQRRYEPDTIELDD